MYKDFNKRRDIILNANKKFKEKIRVCVSKNNQINQNCEDSVSLDLEILENKLKKIQFCASGCSLLIASCYLFEKILLDKTIQETKNLLNKYNEMINFQKIIPDLYDLNALFMVKNHQNRVVCVSLAKNLLRKVIKNYGKNQNK
ncbi:iron-sulfur cluster assembly scaffold protein [Mycoplasma flocculare]|uniref:NifU family protein n=2 Tax=Mesomycoplasma flocculare TaxID=2128 RepID=A0A0A8ECP8_MESFC|nr:iron-sulfur cluster assembly scaffold protein [Mesomycoplasma flocculare]MXR39442.1 iron-sulfur cluster assembly scaffold protein [Mycoplasma sp. MF12]AJC49971.1 NifU family protein [Mesomycoplasma flocculare ATCC 27399]MXR05851.1 iron-sulfur cluster assembly scaffold protein [Mesomycoplasma flocculare]MXR12263.1 iron-sulfur cluster assembly scaffold protein [Mesomycoplasma flocculare]MXR13478.1 iron-sulfur cluster assembly scaffold protein [Mesomycoplasma flocculare]